MVLVLLTTKDDPKYGPYVNTGLFVDVGLLVGTSLPSDTGDLSGGSDPIPIGYVRGGLSGRHTSGSIENGHSTSRLLLYVTSTRAAPPSTGSIKIPKVHSGVYAATKGEVKSPQATKRGEGSSRGYHFISRSTAGKGGRSTGGNKSGRS